MNSGMSTHCIPGAVITLTLSTSDEATADVSTSYKPVEFVTDVSAISVRRFTLAYLRSRPYDIQESSSHGMKTIPNVSK